MKTPILNSEMIEKTPGFFKVQFCCCGLLVAVFVNLLSQKSKESEKPTHLMSCDNF